MTCNWGRNKWKITGSDWVRSTRPTFRNRWKISFLLTRAISTGINESFGCFSHSFSPFTPLQTPILTRVITVRAFQKNRANSRSGSRPEFCQICHIGGLTPIQIFYYKLYQILRRHTIHGVESRTKTNGILHGSNSSQDSHNIPRTKTTVQLYRPLFINKDGGKILHVDSPVSNNRVSLFEFGDFDDFSRYLKTLSLYQ